MRFEILNVEHGFAAYAEAYDGSIFLFDCGATSTLAPSKYLRAREIYDIQRLFITNYDEDHISDLPSLYQEFKIEVLVRNPTLTSTKLESVKEPSISKAMEQLLEMIDRYNMPSNKMEPLGLRSKVFYNQYPMFKDTNNLSLLTFLDVGDLCFAITGDLEHAGWLELLKNPRVIEELKRVDVFIASHHGRESGYCREVFNFCKPQLIVMSDGAIQHDTQKMVSVYDQYATGGWFRQEWRKVITTRNDGHICFYI